MKKVIKTVRTLMVAFLFKIMELFHLISFKLSDIAGNINKKGVYYYDDEDYTLSEFIKAIWKG